MTDPNVPELVEEIMETYGLTQAELGARIFRDQSTVSAWKRGKSVPDRLTIHILTCNGCREHFFAGEASGSA